MLVMIKAVLYERTVALCASMDFGKVWEDPSFEVTAGGPGGGRRDYDDRNQYSKHFWKNTMRKIFSTRSQRIHIWIEQHRWLWWWWIMMMMMMMMMMFLDIYFHLFASSSSAVSSRSMADLSLDFWFHAVLSHAESFSYTVSVLVVSFTLKTLQW